MLYLHIGLPRTSSTFIQKKYFKLLEKKKFIILLNYKTFKKCNKEEVKNMINSQRKYLISNEEILNYDPHNWLKYINILFKTYGNKVKIICFIRRPSEYCRSVYLQYCIKQSNLMLENNFFLDEYNYHKSKNGFKFNIDRLNYFKLVQKIKGNFQNFLIVKYEDYKLEDIHMFIRNKKLKDDNLYIDNQYINTSYSKNTVNLIFLFKKYIKFIFDFFLINFLIKIIRLIYLVILFKFIKKFNPKLFWEIFRKRKYYIINDYNYLYNKILNLICRNFIFRIIFNIISINDNNKYILKSLNFDNKKLRQLDRDYTSIDF